MTSPTPASPGLLIRPAHPDDRDAFIRLAQVSFAEENIANGLAPAPHRWFR